MKFDYIKYYENYGSCVLISRLLMSIANKWPNTTFFHILNNHKHQQILKYLRDDALAHINHTAVETKYAPSKKIWIMWWQGEENAFPVVKANIASIRCFAKGWSITVISKNNVSEYINLPPFISEKVLRGQMSVTHLSDYLRFALLKNHGGLWIDPSIFATAPINVPEYDHYWTYRQPEKIIPCISHCRWSGIMTYMPKGHFFADYMVSFYNDYWKKHDIIIDYFLIDYLTYIAYQNWQQFYSELNRIPENQPDMFSINSMLNEPYSDALLEEIHKKPFHKVQYKKNYHETTDTGQNTLYKEFISGNLLKKIRQ